MNLPAPGVTDSRSPSHTTLPWLMVVTTCGQGFSQMSGEGEAGQVANAMASQRCGCGAEVLTA